MDMPKLESRGQKRGKIKLEIQIYLVCLDSLFKGIEETLRGQIKGKNATQFQQLVCWEWT